MDDIKRLSEQFRYAIDSALRAGEFKDDFSFHRFPSGCCGDTCILLAQFLLEYGIRTYYVCGFKKSWSHAWLCTDNDIIIDITGEQFKENIPFLNYNVPIYVGKKDSFHHQFLVQDKDIHESHGLNAVNNLCLIRLNSLYKKITQYIV